jgi:hypothetical protein
MAAINLTFAASGANGAGLVTSAFTVDRPTRTVAVFVGSYGTTARVFVQFATSSGGSDWATMQRFDGSGAEFTVFSGNGSPAVAIFCPPTPFGRLCVSSAQLTTLSCAVYAVLR